MRALRAELRRALLSPLFFVGTAVIMLGLLYGASVDLAASAVSQTDALSVFRYSYCFNNSFLFVGVGAAIPFAGSFCEDYRTGMLRLQLTRESRRRYLLAKVLACAVSGGAAVVLACAVFFCVCVAFRGEAASLDTGEWAALVGHEPFVELIVEGRLLLYGLLFCAAQFIYGAFLAVFGLVISMFALYAYAAYAAPFIGSIVFVKLVNIGLWPMNLNLMTLAYGSYFGEGLQTLVVIAGVYGSLVALMALVGFHRLGMVIDHAL